MQFYRNKYRFLSKVMSVVLLLFTSVLHAGEDKNKNGVVATVHEEVITIEDFTKEYKLLLLKNGISDSPKMRESFLDKMIRDKLFVTYAKDLGIDKTDYAQLELERIRLQELINLYTSRVISKEVEITETDLKETFYRLNTKIKASHLFSKTYSGILELENQLAAGANFDSLAFSSFTDPKLKANFGSLGYFGFDEMDSKFENKAYSMEIGEISEPVKTAYGYSIIRVDDIKSNPVLTENEFHNKYEMLFRYTKKRKFETFMQNYVQSSRESLQIEFSEKAVNELFESIQSWDEISLEDSDVKNQINRNKIVAKSMIGDWTMEKIHQYSLFSSERVRKNISDVEQLKEFVAGLVVRESLELKALSLSLDKSEEFIASTNKNFELFLVDEVQQKLKKEFVPDESEMEDFFHQTIESYIIPAKTRFAGILLDDPKQVDLVLKLISANENFEELAKKYSIQKKTAKNGGDLGYFTESEINQIEDGLFKLNAGEISHPIAYQGMFLILKCTEKQTSVKPQFEDVKNEVAKAFLQMKLNDIERAFAYELDQSYQVGINKEKITNLKIEL
ncbi:MAG: peptidylprolyl isomerase [Melioribacteraceae bacterium]|nr:peptidylprolyl isomerase [Melioribacteraceae bacterium]MCF8263199.1 peptidylprolyl isomerase [Melioribacteraceae bacterium]MCF8431283.1 peptidylprolyl isomerase [Melioribacteraceae bacterium]